MSRNERNWRAIAVGMAGAIAIFAVLFAVVGGRRILDALLAADPAFVALTFGFGLCWLAAWSVMLRTILGILGIHLAYGRSFFIYAAAVFANNVTPFGQAGGEPVAALLISRVSGTRYETGLVGIASVDVLNVIPSVSLVLLGVGYYATAISSPGEEVQTSVASVVLVMSGILVSLLLAWRYRDALANRSARIIAATIPRIPVIGSRSTTVDERVVRDRIHRFFGHIERVAGDRRQLAIALGFSTLGWLFQGAALLAAFAALGYDISPIVALFVIPLGNLAGVAPLPGGLGGIEAAFVALLVPTTGVPAAAVTAAVLVYRGAIYWMPVVIGGGSMFAFGSRRVG